MKKFQILISIVENFVEVSLSKNSKFFSKKTDILEIGEKFLINFSSLLDDAEIKLSDISEIYFLDSSMSWNSSRLITLFVKTICSFSDIKLFVKTISEDKFSSFSAENFFKSGTSDLKLFKLIERIQSLKPAYKKCKITNTLF